jgi:hypothetical protein
MTFREKKCDTQQRLLIKTVRGNFRIIIGVKLIIKLFYFSSRKYHAKKNNLQLNSFANEDLKIEIVRFVAFVMDKRAPSAIFISSVRSSNFIFVEINLKCLKSPRSHSFAFPFVAPHKTHFTLLSFFVAGVEEGKPLHFQVKRFSFKFFVIVQSHRYML